MQAALAAGIDIPRLCHHPAVESIGACRICLVEIEKQRALQPACTFPVAEGMVVKTETPAVVESRKFVLNLLFSERNHFCMFCQMSGNCELQDLAYRYKMDHWLYDRGFPKLPVDSSRTYFVMDHNRCILCRRCIRACGDLVGNHTLGLRQRGAESMMTADMDVPFGESSCVSCGTCLQVCPVGALLDRTSAYGGVEEQVQRVKTTCQSCSTGCAAELIVRDNHVLRVESDWDGEVNHGLLCVMGRFEPLYERAPARDQADGAQGRQSGRNDLGRGPGGRGAGREGPERLAGRGGVQPHHQRDGRAVRQDVRRRSQGGRARRRCPRRWPGRKASWPRSTAPICTSWSAATCSRSSPWPRSPSCAA